MSLPISSKQLSAEQMVALLDKLSQDCQRNIVLSRDLEAAFTRDNCKGSATHWFFERRNLEYLLSELDDPLEATETKLRKWLPILEQKHNFYERTPIPFTKTKELWDSFPTGA